MARFEVFDPGDEVIGQNVTAFVECSNRENLRPYLQRYGLDQIEPARWYKLQDFLNVLSDVHTDNPGQAMSDFVSIGIQLVQTAVFPPEFSHMTLIDIMQRWDDAYRLNNRGKGIGWMRCEVVGPKHIKMLSNIPYPDDYNYGVFYGCAQRFLPPGTDFTVYYDEDLPRREQGSEYTITHIEW